MYLRIINGSGFELNFTDASTDIKTRLHSITRDYNGRTFKTGSTSILELSFYSKGSSNLEMVVMEDQGSYIFIIMSLNTTNWCICCSLEPSITHSKRYLFNLFISNLVNFCFGRLDRQSVGRSVDQSFRSVCRSLIRSFACSFGGWFVRSVSRSVS